MNPLSADHRPDTDLARRMSALGIRESDIEESFVRSGGHGGQNVNKTSTCVVLTHRPSGVQVKCQTTRHQGQNRLLARRLLLDKIESQRRAEANARRSEVEKTRRRNRPPSAAAKRRMLQDKSHRASKKEYRRRVGFE
ncbi:MAG: peptide chain release factor-like protein [Verrucomicrobia bacterium]|nr:peptide chain release factor-like protein [Verrucomicrobiota bacterium]